jgi:hypothetical protein
MRPYRLMPRSGLPGPVNGMVVRTMPMVKLTSISPRRQQITSRVVKTVNSCVFRPSHRLMLVAVLTLWCTSVASCPGDEGMVVADMVATVPFFGLKNESERSNFLDGSCVDAA